VQRHGEYPNIQVFPSREKEKEWIALEIERLIREEQIRFSYPLAFDDLGDIIRARVGVERIRQFIQPYGKRDDRNNYIFRENCLTMSTVHGAKGYDAYVVFLAGTDVFSEDEAGRATFYVGATRAKQVLYVTGRKCGLLAESQLVIQRARELRSDGSSRGEVI
jgi:superfamily I DNA/RNA helicase